MATWRRSNHSWSAVRLVRLKIANITQHLLSESLLSGLVRAMFSP
jgi:hypothetical protein